ncbi:hypothetical protein EHO59_13520 [Leptospira semungkisensis]|uniref:Mannosyltransferase n=1 Tax=Leptospira semungkisensis TaxID=2484985 RepID=A0A4R9FQY3_9LEPT|nr:hypothetical protein [Leptospira semungkisensis]TGK00933.1 hypothetical protein EHO59_13520 [Leptospira semungkisensis]
MLNLKNERRWFLILLCLGIAVRIATSIFNSGYLALDDYYILFFSVPAQSESLGLVDNVQAVPEIRSLIPDAIIRAFARTAYLVGFDDPLNQIQFVFACLGILSSITIWIGYRYLKYLHSETNEEPKNYSIWIPLVGTFLLSLHFLMPFVSTRSLIESMSAPFILGSVFCASVYWRSGDYKQLGWSLALLSIASLFRFQAGICAIALFSLVAYKSIHEKKLKDVYIFAVYSITLVLLTGIPDLIFRDSFHSSLRSYISYNMHHSAEYGTSPWYAYIPTILGASLFPFLIGKYEGFPWKTAYTKLIPALIFCAFFLIVHSLIPHKEERFLLPILPLMLIVLAPLCAYWWGKEKKRISTRRFLFFLVNFLLLGLLSFFTIQNNTIELVRYLNSHTEIKELYVYKDSIPHLPVSYAFRAPLEKYELVETLDENLQPNIKDFDPYKSCSAALVVRKDYVLGGIDPDPPWILKANFKSSPLEEFAVSLNPNKNKRRSSLYLYQFQLCKQAAEDSSKTSSAVF